MKLATLRTSGADGALLVVSRDLKQVVQAGEIAPTLQWALDAWETVAPKLERLYGRLNAGRVADSQPYQPDLLCAPLPRAWQWLDASAFPSHGELMQKAFGLPPIATDPPLMYQGMSHQFLGATADVPFVTEVDGIDFEGEFGVITDRVPMGANAAECSRRIRLTVQINDWSLRAIAPIEMKTGFGWIQAKPACSVAPVAVTVDELGSQWRDNRLVGNLRVELNSALFGDVAATEMQYGFHELVAHAARTRDLCVGTVIGSGTVSSRLFRETGSCCIAERRAIEMIDSGAARTDYLRFGDRVRMAARLEPGESSPFGEIDQRIVRVPVSHG